MNRSVLGRLRILQMIFYGPGEMKKFLVTCFAFSVLTANAQSPAHLAETGKSSQTTQQASTAASVSQTSTSTPGAVNATAASYQAAKIKLTEGDVRLYDSVNNMRKPTIGAAINEGDSIVAVDSMNNY